MRETLFSGKFDSVFGLRFGIRFTIQFTRMAAREPRRATPLRLRHLGVLAVLCIVHAWVFRPGNMLHPCAILCLLLVIGCATSATVASWR